MQSYRVAVQAAHLRDEKSSGLSPRKTGFKTRPDHLFFLLSSFLWVYYTTNLLYCDSLRVYGGIILVGPVRSC